jgi:tetratricopeptide (TPR) repeat protein
MLKQYDQALQYTKEALSLVREFGDKFHESFTLNTLGVLYCYKLQRYQEALPYFEKTLEILQKIDITAISFQTRHKLKYKTLCGASPCDPSCGGFDRVLL